MEVHGQLAAQGIEPTPQGLIVTGHGQDLERQPAEFETLDDNVQRHRSHASAHHQDNGPARVEAQCLQELGPVKRERASGIDWDTAMENPVGGHSPTDELGLRLLAADAVNVNFALDPRGLALKVRLDSQDGRVEPALPPPQRSNFRRADFRRNDQAGSKLLDLPEGLPASAAEELV